MRDEQEVRETGASANLARSSSPEGAARGRSAEGPSSARGPRADVQHLQRLARFIRYQILLASTRAGSGHPTSSLSATDLMTALLFGGTFRYAVDEPGHPNNDRLVFSKGHATPLLYALWAAAGAIPESELLTYRSFGSRLEGHPTPRFPYVDAATGSLGQGLSIGVGMALGAKYLDRLPFRTWVLLGDSEMSEGAQWEAIQIAAHYRLDNLVGILDGNRLGQRGETLHGHDLAAWERRIAAFGWETFAVDGHSLPDILDALERAAAVEGRPAMVVARTIKGKGVSFLEDRNGWHGKALDDDQLAEAARELGRVDHSVRGTIAAPDDRRPEQGQAQPALPFELDPSSPVATRTAYGQALVRIAPAFPAIVALDGEVCNSTRAEHFRDAHPDRFFEMYIAEQNMVGVAAGLSARGKIPFVSTFAAFHTRAFDQIRMAAYSDANIKFVGSHAGVSIGEDGPSQMGLEDIAMFRAVPGCAVVHPCDAVSTDRLVEAIARRHGLAYLRTMRQKTPVLYDPRDDFRIGGSRVLRQGDGDVATIVAAGQTVHEALDAWSRLGRDGIAVAVLDAYSIEPIDAAALRAAADRTGVLVTVEDHYAAGGLGEAVLAALADDPVPVHVLAVRQRPRSGPGDELRAFEDISAEAITRCVRDLGTVQREQGRRKAGRAATTTGGRGS